MTKQRKQIVKEELLKALRQKARELSKHFHYHGWAVRPDTDDVLLNHFGVDPVLEILKRCKGIGYGAIPDKIFGGLGLVFALVDHEKREFAVYDEKTNRILLFPLGDDLPKDETRFHWLGVV